MAALCLSVSLLLLSQLSSASTAFRVDEAATRMLLEENATKVSLAVVNPLGRELAARVRLEVLDPKGLVRGSAETDETIKRGASALVLSLPVKLAELSGNERNEMLWYRLRYRIIPQPQAKVDAARIEGIVSLSEITPELFELRVSTPGHAREGTRYHVQVRAQHPISARAVAGVQVEGEMTFEVKAISRTLKAGGVTDAEGYAVLDFEVPPQASDDGEMELKIKGTRGSLTQEAESEISLEQQALVMMSTDKPLYQPGQMLHLRALCFDASKHALSDTAATLTIDDPEGTTVFRAELRTSRFGIASTDWPIPDSTRLGDYAVKLELADKRYEEQETMQVVKISRYDLPNFAVGVKPDRAYYLPGQNAEVAINADYLFGQPVKRGHVRVVRETERSWNYREQKWETKEAEKYEGETEADGRFIARVNFQKERASLASEDYSRYRDLTYAAYFTDPTTNRTEAKRFELRLTKDEIHVYVFEGIERQAQNFPLQFYLSTYYADGAPAECEVQIKDAYAGNGPGGQVLRTVKTNRYGVAKVSGLRLQRPEADADQASLNFVARDGQGKTGRQAGILWYSNRGRSLIRLDTDKPLYRAGESIKATITASEPGMKLVLDVWSGETVLRSQAIELRDGRARLTIPYKAAFDAGVTLSVYAAPEPESADYYYDWPAASRQVLYPRERDLHLSVQLSQQTYKPGEEAHADFNVSAPGGNPVESALGVVIFDKAVEERARTDREFGSDYGFYGAYRYLSGYRQEVSGISNTDLFKLDLSKPLPDGLELVAEILLRTDARVPRVFGGNRFQMSQQQVFSKLIERQTAAMKDVLAKRYALKTEYPRDDGALRAMLSAAGVDFDALSDPWGTPYRTRFSTLREMDSLEIISAGADKRFQTTDDFTALSLSWAYFRPPGETIDRVTADYHARTGKFIRDVATLKAELRGAGVDLDALRDRWGQPYRFDFGISNIHYLINVQSGGPDEKFSQPGMTDTDNFTVWTTTTDYFSESRALVEKALVEFAQKTDSFPQKDAELREALKRSKINFDDLRDPWGNQYYATFAQDARYSDRSTMQSFSRYGETGKLRQEIKVTPVTQRINRIMLRSRGDDGKEGTWDDFDVATFSRVLAEQSARDKRPQPARASTIYAGASGAISGTVVDVMGAVAASVRVKATQSVTALEYEATSDDKGRYTLRNLPVGLYQVEFMLGGFSTRIVEEVPVRSSNLTRLDVTLSAAGASETVDITADNSVEINTTSQQFSNFPSQRTVQSLYSIAPSVVRSGLRDASGRNRDPSVAGSKGPENNYLLDGVSEQTGTPRLRENFSETLIWQPSLETDVRGRAALAFKLADNITTWKMAVVGSTTSGEIGIVEKEFIAFQPFFVEHDPPRVLTEGDEIQLPVVVRNYLDKAQDVNLKISPAAWFTLLGPGEKSARVPAGDSSRQTFDFRASASVTDGPQQITALAASAGDAIVKPVSVHPDGEELAISASQVMTSGATLNLRLPPETIKNSARAELKIYPNLMAHVFESIEGILHRPYGCGEQTISSTYPSLLVLRHDARTGKPSPVAAKALRYLRAGYDRLLNYRTAAGGFSYWGGGSEADIALTAYALKFLSEAQDFIAVDETIINAARFWLNNQQQADGHWPAHYYQPADQRPNLLLTAYIARVLAAVNAQNAKAANNGGRASAKESKPAATAAAPGQPQTAAPQTSLQRALAYLSRRIDEVDEPYLLAAYALAARDAGEMTEATRANAKLRSLAHEENDASYWALETNTPFYGWGRAGRIETTALVVQSLARENQPNDALVGRGLLFLLRQKDRYGVWYSTQATINVLDALVTLLAGERTGAGTDNPAPSVEAAGGSTVAVIINGQRATEVKMPPAGQPSAQIIVDLSPFLAPGENRIELQRDGERTPASVQAVVTYYVPWQRATDSNHPATRAGDSSALSLKLDFDKTDAAIGAEITCRVLAERIGHAGYGMLLAEIGLPPGADVDRASLEKAMKESGWTFSRYDILPDRLVVYLWPQAGGTHFEFKFRPRYGLTAQTAASQLYDYYNPDARAVVAPTKFVVRPKAP
jgi:hypothetical protein